MKVYQAGPVMHPADNGNGWREWLQSHRSTIDWVNPLDKYNVPADDVQVVGQIDEAYDAVDEGASYITIAELVEADKEMIDESDAVLVGWDRVPSVGTPMEVLYAYDLGIPVVVWLEPSGSKESLEERELSPWLRYHTDHISQSGQECIEQLYELV